MPERSTESFFDHIAPFCDIAFGGDGHEVRFIKDVLGPPLRPLLYLGFGTGRVGIPLARVGWQIVGVEQSSAMIERARAKIVAEAVADRVELVRARVTRLQSSRKFEIALALGLFYHLERPAEYREALARCHAALEPGGRLVFDVECRPSGGWGADGVVRLLATRTDGPLHQALYHAGTARPDRQEHAGVFTFETSDAEGKVIERKAIHQVASYVSFEEIRALVQEEDFRVLDAWGSYDGEPYRLGSPELILSIARR